MEVVIILYHVCSTNFAQLRRIVLFCNVAFHLRVIAGLKNVQSMCYAAGLAIVMYELLQ